MHWAARCLRHADPSCTANAACALSCQLPATEPCQCLAGVVRGHDNGRQEVEERLWPHQLREVWQLLLEELGQGEGEAQLAKVGGSAWASEGGLMGALPEWVKHCTGVSVLTLL
jgi:hypothetical protein